MEIRYARMAVKVIEAMDRPTKHRMKEAIEGLPQGDVKRLKGSGELYRLRVGGSGGSYSHILRKERS